MYTNKRELDRRHKLLLLHFRTVCRNIRETGQKTGKGSIYSEFQRIVSNHKIWLKCANKQDLLHSHSLPDWNIDNYWISKTS